VIETIDVSEKPAAQISFSFILEMAAVSSCITSAKVYQSAWLHYSEKGSLQVLFCMAPHLRRE